MKKLTLPFIIGLLAGILLTGICVWFVMPKMMINVHESKLGFDETVTTVENAVSEYENWHSPQTFDIKQNILNAGYGDMTGVKIVTLCQPYYAKKILDADKDKMVSTMMPLGLGIYETKDGKVFISEMNIGLMGKMFGGTISEVMGDAGRDISNMLEEVVKE